ncbi:MAG: cysteine desulfurase [Burkholderiales bacterium]|nr:cysteine desulfurase [Burkholderiales bacterium]
MIYLDYNATTPLDPKVFEAMTPYLREQYGNASSRHGLGTAARAAVNRAREQVAAAVNAQPAQVVFTSGGTEANNLFIKGAAGYLKPSQIVISPVEHPSVARPAHELARAGWKPRVLKVDDAGKIDEADVTRALQEPTGLMSAMLVNNETGGVQDVAAIAEQARAQRAWIHTDAVQAFGKMAVDFGDLNVHAMTISSHKIYGPKGAAALVLDKRIELQAIIVGGGHERGLRSGTENVPAIVGFGAACELAVDRLTPLGVRLVALRERLERRLRGLEAMIFGAGAERIPNTSYFAFPGIDGETLVVELDRAGFAVASGSACSSTSTEPSPTLLAMGVDPALARCAVRVSLGRGNNANQVDHFLKALEAIVRQMKRMSSLAV